MEPRLTDADACRIPLHGEDTASNVSERGAGGRIRLVSDSAAGIVVG